MSIKHSRIAIHLLCEREVARILNVSCYWLQRARCEGRGPDYIKFPRAVRYEPEAIERWIDDRRVKHFTFADGL
jgi:hypothetical protein